MLAANKAKENFAHARALHADAMQSLTVGDIRNAAGKAWDATLAATNVLLKLLGSLWATPSLSPHLVPLAWQ